MSSSISEHTHHAIVTELRHASDDPCFPFVRFLPAHQTFARPRCVACGFSDISFLLSLSGHWLCNAVPLNGSWSCAVRYLLEVASSACSPPLSLASASRPSPLLLRCSSTGSTQPSDLGAAQIAAAETTLVCRSELGHPRLPRNAKWAPLLANGVFASWIAPTCRSLIALPVSAEVAAVRPSHSLPRVPTVFNSFNQYEFVFGTLLHASADAARAEDAAVIDGHASVTWDVGIDRSPIAVIVSRLLIATAPSVGDSLSLSRGFPLTWQASGSVLYVDSSSVAVTLSSWSGTPPLGPTFAVSKSWHSLPFERMLLAVSCLAKSEFCMSAYLRSCLLGARIVLPAIRVALPESWDAPSLRPLNSSQTSAVRYALTHPLTLIQGPPGTGKTETAASLVYHFVNQGRGPVLVCAASNSAGDHLAEKILLTGVSVVRLYSRTHRVSTVSSALTLEAHLESLPADGTSAIAEYRSLLQLRAELGELSPLDSKQLDSSRRSAEAAVLRRAAVVVCTCS